MIVKFNFDSLSIIDIMISHEIHFHFEIVVNITCNSSPHVITRNLSSIINIMIILQFTISLNPLSISLGVHYEFEFILTSIWSLKNSSSLLEFIMTWSLFSISLYNLELTNILNSLSLSFYHFSFIITWNPLSISLYNLEFTIILHTLSCNESHGYQMV